MNAQEAELLKLYNSLSDGEASQLSNDEIADYERLLGMSKNEPSPIWGGVAGYDKNTPTPTGEMQPEAQGQAKVKPTMFQGVSQNVDKYIRKPMRSTLAAVEALPALATGEDMSQRAGNYADRYQTLADRPNDSLNIAEQVATDPVSFVSAPAKALQAGQLAPKFARFAMTPAIETATQISANMALNNGEVDPTGMAVGTGIGAGIGSVVPMAGRYLKKVAPRQLYGSIVAGGKYTQNKNPITPEKLEKELLAKHAYPVFTNESNAFNDMLDFLHEGVAKDSKAREELANGIDTRINLGSKMTPTESHFEAVPSESNPVNNIDLKSNEEMVNQGRSGAYQRAFNKWDKDPYASFMQKPDAPNLIENPKDYLQGASVKDWELQEVIDKHPEKIKGAVEKAIQSVRIRFKNEPTIGKKVIANIEEWADDMGITSGRKKTVGAPSVSGMVTDLTRNSRDFGRIGGATTPFEVSRSELASAINNEIEKNIPELRAATRKMADKMSIIAPIQDRSIKANTVALTSGTQGIPVLRAFSNIGTTLSSRPQGAMLKYRTGEKLDSKAAKLIGQARRFAIPTSNATSQDESK